MAYSSTSVPWPSLFLIGFSSLAYEVLLIRVFSILHWHHFAAMAIGLALLGHGASGAFIAVFRQWLLKRFHAVFIFNLFAFVLLAPVSFYITQIVQFNTLEMVWDIGQWWRLLIIEVVLMLPFFFAASAIGLSICFFQRRLSLIYGTELLGAGIGAITLILLLYSLSLINILAVIIFLGGMAGVLALVTGYPRTRRSMLMASISLMIVVVLCLSSTQWPKLEVAHYKALNHALQLPKTRIVYERSTPLGLITVLSSPTVALRMASGTSLNFQGEIPEQLGLFIDGESVGGIIKYAGDAESIEFLDASTGALPYQLVSEQSDVLIVGLGAGESLLQASIHKPGLVDVIEPNAQLITVFTDRFKVFSGVDYLMPYTHFNRADIRGWLKREARQYNLIQLQSLEGMNASVLSLREQHHFTKEALENYWQALSQDGVLSVTLWMDIPPRAAPRVVSMLYDMLSTHLNPALHIAVIRSWQTVTIVLSKSVLSDSDNQKIRAFCELYRFDLVYYPGIRPEEVNRFNQLQSPYYYQIISGLLDDDRRDSILEHYAFDLSPTLDDRPFFYHFLKVNHLADLMTLWRRGGEALLPQGYLILWVTLIQALLLSLLLIIFPLYWLKHRQVCDDSSKEFSPREQWRSAFYFMLIGLAFLMVELVMVERFTLFLSHPAITGATIIGSFLVFSGLGSLCSHRISRNYVLGFFLSETRFPWLIFACCVGYIIILPWVFETYSDVTIGIRVMISFSILSPLAFMMGMPFPMGLRYVYRHKGEAYLPWVWGINGCASVVSVNLATLLAVHFGFTIVLLLGAVLYLLSAFVLKTGPEKLRGQTRLKTTPY